MGLWLVRYWVLLIFSFRRIIVVNLMIFVYNISENKTVLLHQRWVLWRFWQDGKIKIDRVMKRLTRGRWPLVLFIGRINIRLPENDYQILRLTDLFYEAYSNPPYVELLEKRTRAYNCLLFQTHYDYFICVPFRTEITHGYLCCARHRKDGITSFWI